jgi:N-acetylmuramoyl-L-alanine amidase
LKFRALAGLSHPLSIVAAAVSVVVGAGELAGQQNQPPSLTMLSREGRRAIPLSIVANQEFVALDDLATTFQLTVREESGAITVSYKGRTIVLTPDQPLASVAGRLISLPAAPARVNAKWHVPVDFIGRALAPIYDVRLDLRRPSHLLVVGNVRVPRVAVRYEPLANAARLTINIVPRTGNAVVQEGGRLVIRFDADALDASIPGIQPQPLVQAIRQVDGVTLGVDLGPRFAAARTSAEVIDNTTRLTIDLTATEPPSAAPAAASPGAPPAAASAAGAPPVELPAFGRAATIRTIVLDPGHGGDDAGARGVNGSAEKDVTLAAARRLKAAIESRLGARVLLTRDDDRRVSLNERTAIANNSKVDLFISLHANAAPRPAPSGASIHVVSFNETEQTRAVLAPEPVPVFGGRPRDIELVPWDLAQLRYLEQSTSLAQMLEQQFEGRVPLDRPSSAAAPLRVLESANMPAVLIELGYLTNAGDERRLTGADFQNTLAQAVVDAVMKFRDSLENGAPEEER